MERVTICSYLKFPESEMSYSRLIIKKKFFCQIMLVFPIISCPLCPLVPS
jgi:hypothetical protein